MLKGSGRMDQNGANPKAPEVSDLERILEIPLEIHVELGRRRMRISELLSIGTGGILELNTAAGAPLSLYANQTLIATGEAVVVGERYGVRVTDIISPHERVRRLGGAGGEP
jgi:flagellar motor switch protein FliN/FliY